MISREKLMEVLIKGRKEGYVRKSRDNNPYKESVQYDWEFKLKIGGFLFIDMYRGANPYSGVEYVYASGVDIPVWACDYVGYVVQDTTISADRVYEFLKDFPVFNIKMVCFNIKQISKVMLMHCYWLRNSIMEICSLLSS